MAAVIVIGPLKVARPDAGPLMMPEAKTPDEVPGLTVSGLVRVTPAASTSWVALLFTSTGPVPNALLLLAMSVP